MIYRKSPEELESMRRGAKILTETLNRLEAALTPGVTTRQLDAIAEATITGLGGIPSFKGYRGFPASICTSPNEVIVHGIPNDNPVSEGDIVSLDVGVLYEGLHTDSAWTFPVGNLDEATRGLLETTEKALYAAVVQCRVGKRVGDVGAAVEEIVEGAGYGLVKEYVGHGVGRKLHEDPQIPNYGPPGRREGLRPGMTLAIEPMVNLGTARTEALPDGWTVVTADGSRSAHFEHTVAITGEGPEVLTQRH
jgi:methionyl aminopeptidase